MIKILVAALIGLLVGSIGTQSYVQITIPQSISIDGTLRYLTAPPVHGAVPTTKFIAISKGGSDCYLRNMNANRLYFWGELVGFNEFDVVGAVGYPEYWDCDYGNGTWKILSVVNIQLAVPIPP